MSGLLNYTTSIAADKTVAEIQAKLAKAGARQILQEYDGEGNVLALSFRINTRFGNMAFSLPADIDSVTKVLQRQSQAKRIPPSYATREQATRVGWRIVKDWVEAQLAFVETGMVTIEQAFLAYAQNASGQTVYEALLEKKFTGLALFDAAPQKVVNMP